MDELIDLSLKKLIALDLPAFKAYKPVTVADALAEVLIKDALGDGGVRAIAVIADRAGGRATQKKVTESGSELSQKIAEMLERQTSGRR